MALQRGVRYVAVDDNNPSIGYTGNWEVTEEQFGPYNRFGPPHGGSQHVTHSVGSLSFDFEGMFSTRTPAL